MPKSGGAFTGAVSHGDNVKAKFGTGDDLQIYHTGSHSFVDDAGTGNLYIRSNSIVLGKYTGEYGLSVTADGSTDLYYDNALKLASTSTGVNITGQVTSNATSGYTRLQDLNTAVVSGTDMGGVEWRTGDSSVSGANRITAKISAVGDGTFNATDKAPTKLVFATHGSSGVNPVDRLTINSTGKVGIGTSSPTGDLSVHSSNNETKITLTDGNTGTTATDGLLLQSGAANAYLWNYEAGNLIVGNSNAEAMRINGSNNVLIGDSTADRASKLVVSGNGSSDVASFMYNGNTGTYLQIDCAAPNGVVELKADARSGNYPPLTFKTGNAEAMRIDAAGIVTKPLQPAFQVRGGSNVALPLQTYTIVNFNIETFDQNSDFNTTTKTFTAPVTGKYQFNVQILWGNWDSGANYYYLQLQTSNRTYYELYSGVSRPSDPAYCYGHIHVLADMDAGDVANVQIYQNQGTSQTTYDDQTIFTGHLVC